MSYITSNQGRPIQGVSQQPEKVRLAGQCTQSDNFKPDIVRGLSTRPGAHAILKLLSIDPADTTKWHHYERGTGEEYFLAVQTDGLVRIWSPAINGHPARDHPVTVEGGSVAYLTMDDAHKDLKMMTIGDYTFLVNTTKNIEVDSVTKSPAAEHKALFYCQFANYGQIVNIFLQGFTGAVASYELPDGSESFHIDATTPDFVTYAIYQVLTTGTWVPTLPKGDAGAVVTGQNITSQYTVSIDSNVITLQRIDLADFTITVNDDADNKNSVAIKGKVSETTLLPGRAPEGFKVEVDPPGAATIENSSYWLVAENTGSNHVTWKESIEPGLTLRADPTTMPHVLVRESYSDITGIAQFTLRPGEWEGREVGNNATNPHPTFLDETNPVPIQSLGIFQNRLFFTAGESVIMTRSDNFFNFYRETAQAALETDPIDVYADVAQVNFLDASVSFDGDLVFFSTKGQFILSGDDPVTAKNATLRQATQFESELAVDPVASGDNVFFCFNYGRFTGVREFFTDSITDTKRARPVTDHVKQFIKGTPRTMASSTNLNMLIIRTDADENILYVYDWLWQGAEKVQSAWGKWIFPADTRVLHFKFVKENLFLAVERPDGVYLEKIDMGDTDDIDITFPFRADHKTDATMIKSDGIWYTADAYPNVDVDRLVMVARTGAHEGDAGTTITLTRPETPDGFLYTDEDLGDSDVEVSYGYKITATYIPTNPVAKDENGQALNLDRLTVGAFYMNYNTTGDLIAYIQNPYGGLREHPLTGRTLGGPENLVGFAPLVPGQHRVTIRQKSDRYTLAYITESHIPLEIRDFEFNGNLNRRGRRI